MTDYDRLREQMVDNQLRTSDVQNYRVLEAMGKVPRELFVPEAEREMAYRDAALQISSDPDRFLTQPAVLARMIQAADVSSDDVVLEIGCGSGYASAILAELANSVIALDEDAELVGRADRVLEELELGNVGVIQGDLLAGCPDEAPFDAIVITAAIGHVPQALLDQLKEGGRLICGEGAGLSGEVCVYQRFGDSWTRTPKFNAALHTIPNFELKKEFVF